MRDRARRTAASSHHGLAPRLADPVQSGVAGKPENVAAALIFQPVHDLGRAVMAIAAHGDLDPRPVLLETADDVLHNPGRLFSGGPLAGAQQRQHRLARGCLEDVDGLEAVLVIMGVEQRQLLAAVDGIGRIVDVEDDALGNAVEAFAEQIDHRQPHARQLAPRWRILKPRQGWLRHQIATALGQAPTGQLERRIEAQHVEVVAILVAAGDGEHARPDHVGVRMGRAGRSARVGQATGKARSKTEPFLDPAQQQHAAVGRQPAAVKTGAQLLVCDR